jgi:hypothetical protein
MLVSEQQRKRQNDVEKKTWIIIALSIAIGILIWIIISGDIEFETIIGEISGQRDDVVRSTEIIQSELEASIIESAELRINYNEARENNTKLKSENNEYRIIIESLTAGSQKTDEYISQYGDINSDFENFIRQESETN